MPEKIENGADSFSKLRNLISKSSPQALFKSIPDKFQKIKDKKNERSLDKDLIGIDKRNVELDGLEIDNKNNIKEARIEALRGIYSTLEKLGVDPSSLESIGQFREKLMQEDPDLAELFFNAFDSLTQGLQEDEAPVSDQPLLDTSTTNLQEPLLRQAATDSQAPLQIPQQVPPQIPQQVPPLQ